MPLPVTASGHPQGVRSGCGEFGQAAASGAQGRRYALHQRTRVRSSGHTAALRPRAGHGHTAVALRVSAAVSPSRTGAFRRSPFDRRALPRGQPRVARLLAQPHGEVLSDMQLPADILDRGQQVAAGRGGGAPLEACSETFDELSALIASARVSMVGLGVRRHDGSRSCWTAHGRRRCRSPRPWRGRGRGRGSERGRGATCLAGRSSHATSWPDLGRNLKLHQNAPAASGLTASRSCPLDARHPWLSRRGQPSETHPVLHDPGGAPVGRAGG